MTVRVLNDSILRYSGLGYRAANRLPAVAASGLRPVGEQLAELQALAPELSPEVRQLLAARGVPIPAAGIESKKNGVLNLLSATAGNGTATPGSRASLDRRYGPGATAFAQSVELLQARTEAALLSARQGASPEQLLRILGQADARSLPLAQRLKTLADVLGDPTATVAQRAQAKCDVRQQLRDAALPPGSVRSASAERLLDEQFRLTAARPEQSGERALVRDGTEVDTVVERGSPLGGIFRVNRANAADFVPVRYAPGSPEAIQLFKDAARLAGVPESWATSDGLHSILQSESDGWVGKPNYTYGKRSRNKASWGDVINELRNGDITTRSSASGLGQLLLANVDAYYPSGRDGIGVPVEEAAGMLRYIEDRYGDPERAWELYGVLHEGY